MRTSGSPFLAVLLVACAAEKSATDPAAKPAPAQAEPPAKAEAPAEVEPAGPRYEGSGTVLDKQGVGPQLCLGAVAESLPPQCRGVPLVGWDWAKVEGEQTAGDTTWGEYRVVGTYDGQRLTPTEPPGPPQYTQDDFKIETPCTEPAGGWARPDPKKMRQADLDRVNLAAQKMPGYAGLWLHNLVPPRGEVQDPKDLVVNVAFSGDLAKREAELRKLWGGALCVVQHKRSEAELAAVRTQAEATIREMGLGMLDSSTDVVRGRILVGVTAATAEQLAELKAKYGDELVVTARLRPLP
jgi:hypothetical protein